MVQAPPQAFHLVQERRRVSGCTKAGNGIILAYLLWDYISLFVWL